MNVLENPELADATIPMNYLSEDKTAPPLRIIHGGRDMLVPFTGFLKRAYLSEVKKQLLKISGYGGR